MTRPLSRTRFTLCALLLSPLVGASEPISYSSQTLSHALSLQQAEILAVDENPAVASIRARAKAVGELADSEAELPNPQMQLGLANLPTDSFDFDQENMTQLHVGISQQIPGGNRLELRREIGQQQSQGLNEGAQDIELQRLRDVRKSWLELYYLQQSRQIVLQHKQIFAQLLGVVHSAYEVGRNNQHDVLLAELEMGKLDSELIALDEKLAAQQATLSRWIGDAAWQPVSDTLPNWRGSTPSLRAIAEQSLDGIYAPLMQHPLIVSQDNQLKASELSVELAKEAYKPNWGVNLGYGYRDDTPAGDRRADFFSASVSVELPWFAGKRQDKQISSSLYQQKALQNQRLDTLQQMQARLLSLLKRSEQLEKNHRLFETQLLTKAQSQAKAALSAYQNDRGDFSSVVEATIADLNAQRQRHRIAVNHLQTQAEIRYLLPHRLTQASIAYYRTQEPQL